MAAHFSVLAWKIPWTTEPGRLQSMGSQRVGHDRATSLSLSNYDGGNEDNGDFLQKVPCMHCYTQCPQPCSRPPLTHTTTRDSWILMGKSGSVSCGVTAHFSWVLVHTWFCLCPQEFVSQSYVSSGGSVVGLMVTSSKAAYAIPRSAAPRAPAAVHF